MISAIMDGMTTHPKKVLIIEDEKPMARALELKLGHEGFEVTVINNGENAPQTPFDVRRKFTNEFID